MSACQINSQRLQNNCMKQWTKEPGENLIQHEQECGWRGRSYRGCWREGALLELRVKSEEQIPGRIGEKGTEVNSKEKKGTCLVAQWLRIHLPMQGTMVRSLVWEDPTCHGATKPVLHNYWACTLEPASHNYWAHTRQLLKPTHSRAHVPQLLSPHAATTDACTPRACAPQQKKPPQWEACAPQRRVAPARHN